MQHQATGDAIARFPEARIALGEEQREPGADIPIHRHPEKEESFVVLRGKIRITTYNDDGSIIEDHVISPTEGRYGVNVEKNVWHTVEALEPDSVIFECKEGPYVPHDVEGVLKV